MGIAEILALAPAAISFADKIVALIEKAHAKGEITTEEMNAALGRKKASEDRWDEAVGTVKPGDE